MEYSNHQKERIAKQLLEFYKDGKYAYDEDAKRQTQTHYNKKSDIIKCIEKWTRDENISRWIIPIIDYNLETDYESLEKEWDKNHRLAIKFEDLENKYHNLEHFMERNAKEKAKEMMNEWVSEKEDVAKLHEEIEELKNRRSEMLRRHTRSSNGLINQNNQLKASITKMEDERREANIKSIESELNDKKETPSLKKQVKRLENQNMKLEKENMRLQKKAMEGDMKFLELKAETDLSVSHLKTDIEKLNLELNYYKIKDSVEAQSLPQLL